MASNKEEFEYGILDTLGLTYSAFPFRSLAGTSRIRGGPMLPTAYRKYEMFMMVMEVIQISK